MATVFLGLGSNIRPQENLRFAVAELRTRYSQLEMSSVYRSKALGFAGEDFLNLVAKVETSDSAAEVCSALDEIHQISGRERGSARYVSRTLDIDLLLYDSLVVNEPPVVIPRSDVLQYSFVLIPLAELAANYVHPVTGRTIAAHAIEFDQSRHPLESVNVDL